MEWIYLGVWALLIIGFLGTLLPMLPGLPLSYAGLVWLYFAKPGSVSVTGLVVQLVIVVFVSVLDYVVPPLLTKKGGGSKSSVWGTVIGSIIGLFFLPWGIIVGPFLGAVIGEHLDQPANEKNWDSALKIGAWSFLAFILTTGAKAISAVIIALHCIKAMM